MAFWIAYILTRPLGACLGDFLTLDRYPTYSGADNCFPVDSTSDDVGCEDPDIFCVTNCASYSNCTDVTLTCPVNRNPCNNLEPTCYTPLPCNDCWGLEGLKQTNIAFAAAVVVLVTLLTITRYDVIIKPIQPI